MSDSDIDASQFKTAPRGKTMTPTMTFRWAVPSLAAYSVQPSCARLQQQFYTSEGVEWHDVRVVEVAP